MKRGEDGMRAPMGDVSMNDLGDPMGDPCMAAWATLHPRAVQGALGGSCRRAASTRARDAGPSRHRRTKDTGGSCRLDTGGYKTNPRQPKHVNVPNRFRAFFPGHNRGRQPC
jgi:hypothetical protein